MTTNNDSKEYFMRYFFDPKGYLWTAKARWTGSKMACVFKKEDEYSTITTKIISRTKLSDSEWAKMNLMEELNKKP